MKNFQAIKEMNIKEMTAFLYVFLLPWTKAYSDEQKKALWNSLEAFLMCEVKTFKETSEDGERKVEKE